MAEASLTPELLGLRIPDAERVSGFSRSEIYRRAARPEDDPGRIILRKCGRSVLVDLASLRRAFEALPVATIGARETRKHGAERQGEAA